MNKLQQEDLEILKYYKKFVDENNLKYILYAGTMLGAVRHKGFIPWDDDVDVAMLREDFDKFEQMFIKSDYKEKNYIYQSPKIYPFQANTISKIRSKTMNIKERLPKSQKGNYGPWIDIFPFENTPTDIKLQRELFCELDRYNQIIKNNLLRQVEPSDRGIRKILKMVIETWNNLTYKFNPKLKKAFKNREDLINRYRDIDTEYCADMSYMYFKDFEHFQGSIMKKTDFNNVILQTFEDDEYNIPSNYDEVLTNAFGDYMTLPAVEDQKKHKIDEA